jgi:L-serine dehydratase
MSTRHSVSVFDIIGPIMVGPSSSHTAGAVRLGLVARAILGEQPAEAFVELHGSFAHTGRGHGTERALVAGLLGMKPADERIRHSLELAATAGMHVRFAEADLGQDAHPNSVRLTLKADQRTVTVEGASIGGGMIRITRIEGYDVLFTGEHDALIVVAEDRPGTIHTVTGLLLAHQINIAFSRVERRQRGGEAIMIFETDDPIPALIPQTLTDFYWVRWARHVPKVTD